MTGGCRKSARRRWVLDRARTAAAGSAVIAARKGIRPSEQHVRVVVSRPALFAARCPWALWRYQDKIRSSRPKMHPHFARLCLLPLVANGVPPYNGLEVAATRFQRNRGQTPIPLNT